MALTRTCPVPRTVNAMLVPAPTPIGRIVNGSGQQQAFALQFIAVNTHELRVFDAEDYLLYCIHCGEIAAQRAWNQAALTPVEEPGNAGN